LTEQSASKEITELAKNLRLLLLDVDGVLTDGGIILNGNSEETKRFNVQDGMGITLAQACGIRVGIITSRTSKVVERRAKELKIEEVMQDVPRKTDALEILLEKHQIEAAQACYIGDDIQDTPVMKLVGVPIAVQNAVPLVKECSVYVTQAAGGHGAVREAVEWILSLRGQNAQAYAAVLR
jgi:3-deoxy-D-manno-octulosonate 8-phosphate phosphatase (KDO 8-P phosphatase)